MVGLPRAFTPTWSTKTVPGYPEKQAELKANGISDVIVYCPNDFASITAGGKNLKIEGSMASFYGDSGSPCRGKRFAAHRARYAAPGNL